MDHGICLLSVVPCRVEPNDRSELVTQLLFGDLIRVHQKNDKWLKIEVLADGYKAWVDKKQIQPLSKTEFKILSANALSITEEILTPVHYLNEDIHFPLAMGSRIIGISERGNFTIGDHRFHLDSIPRKIPKNVDRKRLVEDAFSLLNAPYLWGGKTLLGLDCSGFTQLIYSMNGLNLPRDSEQQADLGHALSFIEEAEEGDLAFFDNDEGRIIHVGIMLEKHRIIHASGMVRIDRIDHQGIFRPDLNDYSHKLRIIKKIL